MASPALPPDLLAALAGAGPAPAAGGPAPADQAAAAQDQTASDPTGSSGGGDSNAAVTYVNDMIEAAQKYLDVEPDAEDKALVSDILARLHKLLAKDQQEADGAMQGKMSPRLMRKVGSAPAA